MNTANIFVNLPTIRTEYTAFNKISKITKGDRVALFTYGPDQERIAMKDGSDYVMVYNGNYEAMLDLQGNITKEWTYIYDPGGKLVAFELNDAGTKTLYSVLTDHLGSPIWVYNTSTNTSIKQRTYDPYGLRNENDLSFLRRGFTMHEHLDNFGLINMNGRLYDPVLGRFIQPDPYVAPADNAQAYNGYNYCLNNPLKYTDPSGELAWFVVPIIVAAVAGTVNLGINAAQGNVNSFSQGVGYFSVGALAGGVTALTGGVGGFILGGMIQGGGNTAVRGGSLQEIIRDAGIGGVAGGVGGAVGGAVGGGIANLALRYGLQGAVGAGAGGFTGGFLGGVGNGESFGDAIVSGLSWAAWGIAIGGGLGLAGGVYANVRAGNNAWSGKPISPGRGAFSISNTPKFNNNYKVKFLNKPNLESVFTQDDLKPNSNKVLDKLLKNKEISNDTPYLRKTLENSHLYKYNYSKYLIENLVPIRNPKYRYKNGEVRPSQGTER